MKKDFPDIPTIILAEPEEAVRESIETTLIEEGYDCHAVTNAKALLQAVRIHQPDLIITDVQLIHDIAEEMQGVQNQYGQPCPVLITLSYEQVREMLYLMKFKITEYIIKPFPFDEMIERIHFLLAQQSSQPVK